MTLEMLQTQIDRLGLPRASDTARPDLATLRALRDSVTDLVATDGFLKDCLSRDLTLMSQDRLRTGLVPFHVLPETGARCALGYWAPGATPGPHQHSGWTVTAVCRNRLEVQTFDRQASLEQQVLVAKNRFLATVGQVGYIAEPAIHAPTNTSNRWTLSFHLSGPHDGVNVGDERPISGLSEITSDRSGPAAPYVAALTQRQRQRHSNVAARIAATLNHPERGALLRACARLGTSALARWVSEQLGDGSAGLTDWELERSHSELELWHTIDAGRVTLWATTPDGPRAELIVDTLAASAIAFVAEAARYRVQDLPGALSRSERVELGIALEHTGLFKRSHRP